VNYTIGQRRGLPARGGGEPLFVIDLDAEKNTVIAGDNADLMAGGLTAEELSFISGEIPQQPMRIEAKIRYRSEPVPSTLRVEDDLATVHFDRPQRAVTPGQAVVFYDGERVLGGGAIVRRL
jgi:tRNA-specific 2-thiouridylase